MMNPRLFNLSTNINDYFVETTFNGETVKLPKFGKNEFLKIKSIEVKRNIITDEYTLNMVCSAKDEAAKSTIPGNAILCPVKKTVLSNHSLPQIFVVQNIDIGKTEISISASHIKYLFFTNMILPDIYGEPYYIEGTFEYVLNQILSKEVMLPNAFTVRTVQLSAFSGNVRVDVGSRGTITLGDIFSDSGDIRKYFPIEFVYDNFDIIIRYGYGIESDIVGEIRDGLNVSSFEMNTNLESVYTDVVAYATVETLSTYSGEVSNPTLYSQMKHIYSGSAPVYRKILFIDYTRVFSGNDNYRIDPNLGTHVADVKNKLSQYAEFYKRLHQEASTPTITCKIDVAPVLDSLNYITAGDYVQVIYEPIQYSKKQQVVETTFNPLTEKLTSLTIGEAEYKLFHFIRNIKLL